MLLSELTKNVDISASIADMGMEIGGICFDTRTLRAGDVFVAIKGYEFDGHQYIKDAFNKGASCVICEDAIGLDAPYIAVKNTRVALAEISAAWFGYPASKIKSIGVTGTNGKTSVTTLTKTVIEECTGKKVGLIGTNGNQIGDRVLPAGMTTPESYEVQELLATMVDEDCEYVVMEVSSHALAQSRVHGIEFDVGVFMNLTPEHLDYHTDMDEYARTKALLFEHCRAAAINVDDTNAPVMRDSASCPVFTFAVNDGNADLVGKNIKLYADRVDFSALAIGSLNRVEMGIPGMFTVYNALAVISVAMLIGIDYEKTVAALGKCKGVKGRAEIVPTGRDFMVLIDYAHTPDALENIISATREGARGRIVTLFGCGGDRDRKKRPMMGAVAAKHSDYVIVTSDNPRTETPGAIIDDILTGMEGTKTPYSVIENRREAIQWALENAKTDDVLILAGKGHETYQIFGKEKTHFDEREVVAELLSESGDK